MFGKKKDHNPRLFRVRPVPPPDAKEDNVLVIIDKAQAERHGIQLDEIGFPFPGSLQAWHEKNNPQLFKNGGVK